MWFRVQYKEKSTGIPIEEDDILLEEENMKAAKWYANHRVDGSYGFLDWELYKIKRISRKEAVDMFNGNCISWSSDPNY